MKAGLKEKLPQRGTATHVGVGESPTVALPPAKNGDRATGSPSYSGGGQEPPSATHYPTTSDIEPRTSTINPTRPTPSLSNLFPKDPPNTTTLLDRRTTESPQDPTSLAANTATTYETQNPWVHVEARTKRKKKKKRKSNRRTDSPTGRSGGRSRMEPGRSASTTATTEARGSHGQSRGGRPPLQGRCPPAETVASGKGTSTVGVKRPETNQDPPAETRETLPTDRDNTTAQHRPCPAARQPNTFWKGRFGGAAGGGPNNPGPSSGPSSQKRDRPSDNTPPRAEHKKRRTERPTHTAGSYARATKAHLNVAISLVPRVNMTQQEASSIQSQIQDEIFAACLKPQTSSTAPYAPAFEGRAFLSEGVLKLWCLDEQALSWLQEVVTRLKSPREGTKVALINQTEIPVRVRSALFVPNFEDDVGKLHRILAVQNPWYEVSTWTLYNYHRVQGKTPGVFLVLGIPKEQIDNILARERKVAYSTGTIYIRFFTKEGVSDVPPQETAKPEMPTNMDTDAPTDTTDATDTHTDGQTGTSTEEPAVSTQIPSVSTIVDDIDEVLEEDPPTPSTNTAWRQSEEMDTTNKTDTTALTIEELLKKWAPQAEQ